MSNSSSLISNTLILIFLKRYNKENSNPQGGIFMKQYKLRRYDSDCQVLEFDPKEYRFDLSIGKLYKLEKLSKISGEPKEDEKVVAKMNGCFFSMDGSTEYIGTYVDEGKYYSQALNMYPVAIFWKDYKLTVEQNPTLKRHVDYQKEAFWAIGCPWLLLKDGKKNFLYTKQQLIKTFSHPYTRQPRTMFGQKKDGTIVWVVVDGRSKTSKGMTIDQQATLMQALGCQIAFNADGGGSSEMIYNGKIMNRPSGGVERAIGTAFMCYKKVKPVVSNTPVKEPNEVKKEEPKPATQVSEPKYNGQVVKCTKLNVRNKSNIGGKKIDEIKVGTKVQIIGIAPNGWLQLKYKNYPSAWVSGNYIKWI